MREFAKFTLRAASSQPVQTAAGLAMTVCGVSYQNWLIDFLPKPLPWWAASTIIQLAIIAVGVLVLAYVFWHQANEEKGDNPQIRRIRLQPYSTFDEIASAVSLADGAYSKEEVMERLLKAALNKEFYSLEHHSRMKIKPHPKSDRYNDPPRFYLEDRCALPDAGTTDKWSDGNVVYESNLFASSLNNENSDPDGQIMIERRDFARWHRRFRSGQYEG